MSRCMTYDWHANYDLEKILVDVNEIEDCYIKFETSSEDTLMDLFMLAKMCDVRLRCLDVDEYILMGVEHPENEEFVEKVNRLIRLLEADQWVHDVRQVVMSGPEVITVYGLEKDF